MMSLPRSYLRREGRRRAVMSMASGNLAIYRTACYGQAPAWAATKALLEQR